MGCYDCGPCEMWARAEGFGAVSTNAAQKSGAINSHFCGGPECMCQCSEEGRHVHEQIIQTGCNCNVFVSNSLIDMYAKCGSLEDA